MEYRRPYGTDALFEFPLIDYGATSFESTGVNVSLTSAAGTIAAGDIVIFTDAMVATNPTAHYVKFSTGSTNEPVTGDVIQGDTSLCTATVMFSITTTGTWAANSAAGYMFLKSVSSSFYTGSGSEPVHIIAGGPSSAASNVASFDTGSVAGLFGHSGRGMFSMAATATEMSCKQGWVQVMDQTGTKLWEDTVLTFVTEGDEDALDYQGTILTDSTNTDTGQTTTNIVMSNSLASLGVTPRAGNYLETYDSTNGYQEGFVKSISGDDVTLYPPGLQIGALPVGATVKIYRSARVPAQGVAFEADSITAAAIADNAIDAGAIASNAITTAKVAVGTYSGVTVGVNNIAAGTYSGATVGVNNIGAGTYSGVTVGVNNIGAGSFSGVTVGAGNIAPGTYSGVTVGINNSSITLNANIVQITGDTVTGSGTTADPWRPA